MEALVQAEAWTKEQQYEELKRRIGIFFNVLRSLLVVPTKFTPLSSDVICVVPPKSGTTWLTHICHQIRMQGAEPTFEKQSDVVCWIELSKDDVIQPSEKRYRIFAVHSASYETAPKSDRMIFLFRDQIDTLYSGLKMRDSQLMLKGRVSFSVYAKTILESGDVKASLEDMVVWWGKRDQKNVLFLFYDDLKEDHEGSVRRIASFLGVDCDDETISRIVQTTSHEAMSKISIKFDSAPHFPDLAKQIGEVPIPANDDRHVGRVRKDGGRSGDGRKNLTPELQESFGQLWREVITAKLGFESLSAMREARKKELCL